MTTNSNLWTTNPEYIQLFNFLVEKTKNVEKPLSITQLASEFKIKSGSVQTKSCLWNRINRLRPKIHAMKEIDTETKVRIMFALSAPIDNNFLAELKTQAEVVVDVYKRIIKYKKNGGGLELSGTHKVPNSEQWKTNPEYIELLNFLIKKTKHAKSSLNVYQLAREFKEESGTSRTRFSLQWKIRELRSIIHEMDDIDMDTKVKMVFGLSAPVGNDFLNELKAQADVVLDDFQRIIKYRKKGGGLKLNGVHAIIYEISDAIRRDKRMMDFLAQKSITVDSPVIAKAFVGEFKSTTGATDSITHLHNRYTRLKNKIHESESFDEKTKIRMMFVSSASVPNDFLEILRKDALVEVDENNRITKFKANDGSLEFTGDHSMSAKVKAGLAERKKKHEARKSTDSDSDVESDNDSVDDSSGEFEVDSDADVYPDETEDNIDPNGLDYQIPVRRRLTTAEDDFDYDPPTGIHHRSEEKSRTENRNMNPEADEDGAQNTEIVITRRGRAFKRRYLDSESDDDQDKEESQRTEQQVTTSSEKMSKKSVSDSDYVMDGSEDDDAFPSTKSKKSSTAASTSINPESTKKKRKRAVTRNKLASDDSVRTDELDDYNSTYSFHRTDENATEVPEKTIEDEENEQEIVGSNQKMNQSSAEPTSPKKMRKADTEGFNTSKLAKTFSDNYDPNLSTNDSPRVELKPFCGSLLDNEHLNPMDDDIQVLERPPAPAPKDIEVIEAPIKTEDPVTPQQKKVPAKVKNPVEEETKPKFTSQLKLLEALKTLVNNLDISSLSQIKSKICLKIWKNGKSDKSIPNELLLPAMELFVARIVIDSVTNIDETVESVGFIHIMCYLKAAIRSSKLEGLDSLLEKITKRSEERASKDKRIPVEKMANALQTTLDVIGF